MAEVKGLRERLADGDTVICAEGYLVEFERRGYLKAGAFVPEVVLEHPDLVEQLYEEFVHAGSDIVEAFTYYAHRKKLSVIGREGDLEEINRRALQIARKVATRTGTLMAGNICNTTMYDPDDPEALETIRSIFKEQIEWAVEEGADLIIGETFPNYGEVEIALDTIKQYGNGLPSVLTLFPFSTGKTNDGVNIPEACRQLEKAGADVVGINCMRGPAMVLPLIKEIRAVCKGPVACVPSPYRTHEKDMCFVSLKDPVTGAPSFPADLDCWLCPRSDIRDLTKQLKEIGVTYMGLCCGNRAHYIREMAETIGRSPPASRYSADMSQHVSSITRKDGKPTYEMAGWYKGTKDVIPTK